MDEELIRAACEAANCKYPDMEAMANFKREVTPSVVIGLIDGLRHAKGMAAINDARANGAAETIQHLRDDIAKLRAQLPSQGGEAVAMRQRFSQIEDEIMAGKHTAASVFTQMRTAALYTHPADQVAEGVVAQLREAFPLFDETGLSETEHHCEWNILRERKRLHAVLDALSASGKGVKL